MNSGEPCPRDRQIGRGSRRGWRQSTTRSSASSSGRTAGIRAASSRQLRSCGRRCGTSGEVSGQRPSWTCPEPDHPARSDRRSATGRPSSRRGTIRANAQAIPAPRSSQRNGRGRIGLEGPAIAREPPFQALDASPASAPGPDRFLLRDDGTNRSASLPESFLAKKPPVRLTDGCCPPGTTRSSRLPKRSSNGR